MTEPVPWSAAAFEQRYRAAADPWRFASSRYESRRYDRLLSAASRDRYERALEPGCSVGVLTRHLAERCDRVHAFDVSPTAVLRARHRCADCPHVEIRVNDLGRFRAKGTYDLIVLSEVGYYFRRDELAAIANRLVRALAPGGELIAGHWTGHSADHRLHGLVVQQIVGATEGLNHTRGRTEAEFRWDVWDVAA